MNPEKNFLERRFQVLRAAGLLVAVLFVGTLGFYWLTHKKHDILDCLYMTVITVTTIGYREVISVRETQQLTIFTIALTFFGAGATLYFLTALFSFVVEENLRQRVGRRRMEKMIGNLRNHIVIAGAGRCGGQVARELDKAGVEFVIVEIDPARVDALREDLAPPVLFLQGDALEEAILKRAGLERARGLIAVLPDDRDNLYLCLSARQINPDLRVTSKVDDLASVSKFDKVGVSGVVSPPVIGGRHLASEMLQPEVNSFVRQLFKPSDQSPALIELEISDDSQVIGQSLGESQIRAKTQAMILGIRGTSDDFFHYNPGPEHVLSAGTKVIAIGNRESLDLLREVLQPLHQQQEN